MTDNNAEFGLKCSFGIDNGELDGLSPQEIFVLGFEMGRTYGVCASMDHGDCERFMTHSSNEERNRRAAETNGCEIKSEWANDDWLNTMVSKQ